MCGDVFQCLCCCSCGHKLRYWIGAAAAATASAGGVEKEAFQLIWSRTNRRTRAGEQTKSSLFLQPTTQKENYILNPIQRVRRLRLLYGKDDCAVEMVSCAADAIPSLYISANRIHRSIGNRASRAIIHCNPSVLRVYSNV